jgi:hypothetical protein
MSGLNDETLLADIHGSNISVTAEQQVIDQHYTVEKTTQFVDTELRANL